MAEQTLTTDWALCIPSASVNRSHRGKKTQVTAFSLALASSLSTHYTHYTLLQEICVQENLDASSINIL